MREEKSVGRENQLETAAEESGMTLVKFRKHERIGWM